jgi:N-acetylglutamate synthase-like GNAT family acetyltransferase
VKKLIIRLAGGAGKKIFPRFSRDFMKPPIQIKIIRGGEFKDSIDSFYAAQGSKAKARVDDIYFLACLSEEIIGSVRFCIEEGTPMLRTMLVDLSYRKLGIGSKLLEGFADFIVDNSIRDIYCLPYPHLEQFYAQIGFYKIDIGTAPKFLEHRAKLYLEGNEIVICMKRD